MSEMFPVQSASDFPMPAITRKRESKRLKWPVDTLDVGKMFFVPSKTTRQVSGYISRITKKLPGTFETRPAVATKQGDSWVPCEPGAPGAIEGTGVWRTA